MLEVAAIGPEDVVYDLGCGDGRMVIAAAKTRGARGVGIELDAALVEQCRAAAKREGVGDLVRFLRMDAAKARLTDATALVLYLLPESLEALAPLFERDLRPGARIVSHDYRIPGWDGRIVHDGGPARRKRPRPPGHPLPDAGEAMSAAVGFLAGFCREHPLDDKVLLVPSFVVGRQIGDALAEAAGSWINLRFVTTSMLAAEVLERAGEAGAARPMTPSAELALTDRLFRELLAEGELEYFGRAGASPGLAVALHRAIRELRLDGLTSADLRPGQFLVERKGRELALILARYERALADDGLLDLAGLLGAAGKAAAKGPLASSWVLSPLDSRLSRLEAELVRSAAAGRLVLVPGDPVVGLDRPRQAWPAPGPADLSGAGRLTWLFAPRQAPPEKEARIEIFRALGPANECREILRRLYAEKVPFDQVEILTPPGSAHATVFHLFAARTGLPVTFGDGIPVSFTSPGRLFFGLTAWLAGDFSSDELGRLLENGDLALPAGPSGTALPARTACRLLRNAMIGWGRDRYLERLAALREGQEADLAALATGEGEEDGEDTDGAALRIQGGDRRDRGALGRDRPHPRHSSRGPTPRGLTISGGSAKPLPGSSANTRGPHRTSTAGPAGRCSTGWASSRPKAGCRTCRSKRRSASSGRPASRSASARRRPSPAVSTSPRCRRGDTPAVRTRSSPASTRPACPAAGSRTPSSSTRSARRSRRRSRPRPTPSGPASTAWPPSWLP